MISVVFFLLSRVFGNRRFSGSRPRKKNIKQLLEACLLAVAWVICFKLLSMFDSEELHVLTFLVNGDSNQGAGSSGCGASWAPQAPDLRSSCVALHVLWVPAWGEPVRVSKTQLWPAPDLYLFASEDCSLAVPLPSLLVRDISPTGESIKVRMETDGSETPSISPACMNTACPYMMCMWRKSLKGRMCPVFPFRMRVNVGWHSARLHLNVSFAD